MPSPTPTNSTGTGFSRVFLDRVIDGQSPLAAVAKQLSEQRVVARRGDDQDLADAGHHQRRQRVVDHRLVVHRQQLLADRDGDRVQAGAGAAGEDDAFHKVTLGAMALTYWG